MIAVNKEAGEKLQIKWMVLHFSDLRAADRNGILKLIMLEGIDIGIICNREAMKTKEPYNCTIQGRDYYGNIIAVGRDTETERIRSLTAKELRFIMEQMK